MAACSLGRYGPTPPLPPPCARVVVVVVVVMVVEAVEVVGIVVVVVGVVVVGVVVVGVVVVGVVVELVELVTVVVEPLSEAITASATPSPMTTATSKVIAAFIPVLIPPPFGGRPWPPRPDSSGPMWRVGSSCIAARV